MIRAWAAEGNTVRELPPAEAVQLAIGTGPERVWLDLEDAPEPEVRELLAPLHIHPLVLEDMLGEVNRPKVDDYGDYLYIVVHSARWDEDRPFAPCHGPGEDPYTVHEYRPEVDAFTTQDGSVRQGAA